MRIVGYGREDEIGERLRPRMGTERDTVDKPEQTKEEDMSERINYSINLDRAFGPLELVDVAAIAGAVENR